MLPQFEVNSLSLVLLIKMAKINGTNTSAAPTNNLPQYLLDTRVEDEIKSLCSRIFQELFSTYYYFLLNLTV